MELWAIATKHEHYCFIVSRPKVSYAFNISRRDNTRSIKGLIPSSLEMAIDYSNRSAALARMSA